MGGPVTGDRPDRKATPYYMKIISDDLTQATAAEPTLAGVYAVSSTLHTEIDVVCDSLSHF